MLLTKRGDACTQARLGWVLIRVNAFGLNRTELMTRQGHSPGVAFVRVLDIERTGTVEAAPQKGPGPGETVDAVGLTVCLQHLAPGECC